MFLNEKDCILLLGFRIDFNNSDSVFFYIVVIIMIIVFIFLFEV